MTITKQFIEELFPDLDQGKILIWQAKGKKSSWFDSPEAAAEFTTNKVDTYIGCGLRKEELGEYKRGGESEILAIPGFWFDLDMSHGIHSEKNLPDMEGGLKLLDEMPLRPSVIVDSGGGLQVWWLFKEPWIFEDEKERHQARSALDRWQSMLIDSAALNGWKLDNTSPLSHVLRIPGTLNGKFDPPKLVDYNQVSDSSLRYDPPDIEQYLPDETEAAVFDLKTGKPKTDETYPDQNAAILYERCPWLRHARDDSRTLPEPEWYTMLSILGRCLEGYKAAHDASHDYPSYSSEETNKKLEQAVKMSGPPLCSTIGRKFSDKWCLDCKYWGEVKTPMQLGEIPEAIPLIAVLPDPKLDPRKWQVAKSANPLVGEIFDDRSGELRTQQLKLSYRLVELGWRDQEIANAMVILSNNRQIPVKGSEYYGRIIAISQNYYRTNNAVDFLEEEYGLDKHAKNDRAAVLSAVSDIFRFKITNFIKYMSDPPSYMLETEFGPIDLGDDCLSQTRFRRAIMWHGNKYIATMKGANWGQTIQNMMDVRDEQSVGDEATDIGAMKEWLRAYLKSRPPVDVTEKKFQITGAPFSKDGKTYIHGPYFQKFIFVNFSENIGRRALGTVMRKTGLHSRQVRIGKEVVKCWEVTENILSNE